MTALRESGRLDPRVFQIAALSGLVVYGLAVLRFDVSLGRAFVILAVALLTQWICTDIWQLPRFDPKSALISALSLILLLRTESELLAVVAAIIAISSKFLLRWNGKHIFNPTNIALVALLATGQAWVSPAQWGNFAFFAFLMCCLGIVVVNRARRSDVTFAFLAFFCALVLARAWWLGDPMAIPLHRLQNGALLLFSFFMISDPKTTPDSRGARILFAFLVAAGAVWIQIRFFRSDAILLSLAFFSLLTPLLDKLLPGRRYQWNALEAGGLAQIHSTNAKAAA
jgi:Na+-transporting NADH:ubiquinone oxidoreductase subunit NqrB